MAERELAYVHSDAEALQVGDAAIRYIDTGEATLWRGSVSGLPVFGVIAALRENDPRLYSEEAGLDDEQRDRLDEVEAAVDTAVRSKHHYYPFGHVDGERYAADTRRLGVDSGWGSSMNTGPRRLRDMGMTHHDPREKRPQ